MKITTLIIIMAFVQVSAASFAQKVTFKSNKATMEQMISEIRKQTGYDVLISSGNITKIQPQNVDFKGATLEEVLAKLLQSEPLTYVIEDKTILIKEKEVNLLDNLKNQIKAELAQITVSGFVQDEMGQPLLGVTVKIKDTNIATGTDSKGSYSLNVPDDNAIISFSFIGFETQELLAKDILTGSIIKLKASQTKLSEVVVSKGYYSEKQELTTGSISVITSKEISDQPVNDPMLALVGRVAGLQITQNSGVPGSYETIRLRGQNSIANGNIPLFVVDGVPYYEGNSGVETFTTTLVSAGAGGTAQSALNSLNPSDIESIEVLKDADATAIYGSRGANGVILITTKKGKAGQAKYDFNVYSGIGKATRMVPMLNTQQYLQMRRQAFSNDGVTKFPANAYDLNGTWDTTRYTNWEKLLIGNTSHYDNAQASISGGSTNNQFLIGGGYHRETTIFPGDFSDQKGSLHVNLSHSSSNNKFKANFSAFYSIDNNQLPLNNIASNNIFLPPDTPPIYNSDGTLNWANSTWNNPYRNLYATASAVTDYLNSSLNLSYQFTPDLQFSSNFGYTTSLLDQANLTPLTYYNPASTSQSSSIFGTSSLKSWVIEPQLNYHKRISKGTFNVLLGTSFFSQTQNASSYTGTGYSSDALINDITAANAIISNGVNYALYKFTSVYGRINYDWEEKYILNLTARRDGSTRFGDGKQFGNFGAIGAGWIFSKEKFIADNLPFLSFGKLRASYGITGNDQIGDYAYLDTYSPNTNYQGIATLNPTRLANSNYAWEINKKTEVGLELNFLKDRISLSADYFNNLSSNQLVSYQLPYITGFTSITENLPAKVQNTGLEFTVNTVNFKGKNFSWSSSVNFTLPINQAKLLSYPNLATSSYTTKYIVGQSLFIQELYHYIGVNATTGLYTFQDYTNDGKITTADKQSIIFTGQQFYGGLQNSFHYKNWQLDVFFQFVKRDYVPNYLTIFALPGSMNNQPTYVLNNWQGIGDITNIQKFSNSNSTATTAYSNLRASDAEYSNGSYVRLKNLALAYQLPGLWIQKMHIQNMSIYMQAQNLLTITNYKGLDPENAGQIIPPLRVLAIGIKLGL